jgi:DNA (cytosine-5)-methyltransferase 1
MPDWYEFFSGGGMARIGLGKSWNCVFANDICEKKANAYSGFFSPCPELIVKPIEHVKLEELPGAAELAWASFPCQDLSLAGNGAGLQGKRSGTFYWFWKLILGLNKQDRAPRTIVLENVSGAITSHSGSDFLSLIKCFTDEDYRVGALVINASYFLPQSRPRLFIVATKNIKEDIGHLMGKGPDEKWHPKNLVKAYDSWPDRLKEQWVWWKLPYAPNKTPNLMDLIEESPTGVKWNTKDQTRTLLDLMDQNNLNKVKKVQATGLKTVGTLYKRVRPLGNGKKAQRAEVRFDGVAGCLRTPVGGSSRQTIMVVEGKSIRTRLLSPREAARLMGVPDKYPLPQKYNEAYHVFGDGLAVPVVSHLEKHLLTPLSS